jgi:hypothetical protein
MVLSGVIKCIRCCWDVFYKHEHFYYVVAKELFFHLECLNCFKQLLGWSLNTKDYSLLHVVLCLPGPNVGCGRGWSALVRDGRLLSSVVAYYRVFSLVVACDRLLSGVIASCRGVIASCRVWSCLVEYLHFLVGVAIDLGNSMMIL